jgi:colanic acid biosynthesis glycosyl transferase WcaI
MRLLLLAQHYAPEEVSGAVLATELATDLANRGHQVSFVTVAPSYPQGKVFPGYKNHLYFVEILNNVRVIRTWSFVSEGRSFWRRILNFGTFSLTALYGGLLSGRPDVILSFSPPLPLGLTAWLLSRFWGIPWVLRVEDLYPDSAVVSGVLRNRLAIRILRFIERFIYRRATHISVISEGFRDNLRRKDVPDGKMSVIPVWADIEAISPSAIENEFRRNHDLSGKFIVMYAGNLGHTSSLEDVMHAAARLKVYSDIRFVVVGEGLKRESLRRIAKDESLSNVLFLPYQPREVYPLMMAAADVSLVTLNRNSSETSLPSKTFNIMASARPVLAIVPPDSELGRLVNESCCGVVVSPGQPDQLARKITSMKANPADLLLMGKNGRQLAEGPYSRDQCVDLFEQTCLAAAKWR